MKIPPSHYREIDYVVVDELPDEQRKQLKAQSSLEFIKILISGKVVGPCLQYKHYELWFHQVYKRATLTPTPQENETLSYVLKQA
ncbi:MAG: hypothetical protein MUF68_09320 [Cyclobacteriaceae bacterium]|jgi:hypothetical protein|nr:hypothetical protein [Cyclobacteriaceae bacterium]